MCEPKTLAEQCLFRGNNSFASKRQQTRRELRFHNDNNKSKCKMALLADSALITSTNRRRRVFSVFLFNSKGEALWVDEERLKWWNQENFWDFGPSAMSKSDNRQQERIIFPLKFASRTRNWIVGLLTWHFFVFNSIVETPAVERPSFNLKSHYLHGNDNRLGVLTSKVGGILEGAF